MATKKTGASGKAAPLDPKVVSKLLDKLSTDNEFRRLFKKDPAAALVAAGYRGEPLDRSPLACMSANSIAPKQEIAAARELITQHLMSSLAYTIPHCFEAGKITAVLSRK
ncbi:MAG: NHLP-related RiPP peptide [Pseudoxanthomonas sp.]